MSLHTSARRTTIALCILSAVVGQSLTASAQGCECTCPGRFYLSGMGAPPPYGPFAISGPVPANARIFAWLADYDPSTVRLVQGEREIAVAVEPAAADVPGAYWVVPSEPIGPPGPYTISVSGPAPAFTYETSFLPLGASDMRAPVTGDVRAVPFRDYDACADIVGTGFDLGLEPEPGAIVFEVEVLRGSDVVAHTFTRAAFGTSSDPDCFGGAHVDGLVEGEEGTARVRAWDEAGNASDFVTFSFTPRRALAGSQQPCGRCSVTRVGAPVPMPTWALALVLLGAWRVLARTGAAMRRVGRGAAMEASTAMNERSSGS